MDIDADTPFSPGSLITLRGNSTGEERAYAARMDAISYLRLTGQPITTSAVDSLLNQYRDNVQPVPVDYEGNGMDYRARYENAIAELEAAKDEVSRQIRRQAKTDKLLLIAMHALIISAVVIVLFT